jgi:class 3 adenylate cyclase
VAEDTTSGAARSSGSGTDIRTFLIADIRGYTRYTHEYGDEAGSTLASAFAGIVRASVARFDGELLELRGDEALCVFGSPRQALRASVALQRRFHEHDDDGVAFPLGVGVGIALGEAVPTEGGYRGEALNVAARLCSLAHGGEVLASETVTAVAGRVEGVRSLGRRVVRVKGIAQPLQIVVIAPEVPYRTVGAEARPRARWTLAASVVVALAIAVIGGVTLSRAGNGPSAIPPPNNRSGFATIDPKTNRLTDFHRDVPLTGHPIIATDARSAWVLTDTVVRQVSLSNGRTIGRIPFNSADWVATGAGGLWVNENQQGALKSLLYRINPSSLEIEKRVAIAGDSAWLTTDRRGVWFCANGLLTLVSQDGQVNGRYPVNCLQGSDGADSLVAADNALWVLSTEGVERIDPMSGRIEHTIPPPAPSRVCAGLGAIWVLTETSVVEIDPATNRAVRRFAVPGGQGIAAAFGSVWVGNLDHVIRINPTTGTHVAIHTGAIAEQLVSGGGQLWVSLLD